MEVWVNSATRGKDYYWCSLADVGPADPLLEIFAGYDLWKFEDCIPWFGLVSRDGVSTLYFGNLMTDREDMRTRPIFVHAVIRATCDDERRELFSAAAELLENEKEYLPRWTAYFLGIFDGNATASRPAVPVRKQSSLPLSIGRFAYAREDSVDRARIAQALRESSIESPIVVGTTGRSGKGIFERVCDSGEEWQVAFFSGMCTDKAELVPKIVRPDFPKASTKVASRKKLIVGAGLIVMAIVMVFAIKSCKKSKPDRPRRGLSEVPSTRSLMSPVESQDLSTNKFEIASKKSAVTQTVERTQHASEGIKSSLKDGH